jgi:hypothetical protein
MAGFKLKTSVVTLTNAGTAYAISTTWLPVGTVIQPDAANTGSVHIGEAGVSSSTGFLITTAQPMRLTDVIVAGHYEEFYGPSIYAVGSQSGDKIRIIFPQRDSTAV